MSAGLEQMAQSLELSIFNRAVRHHLGTNFDEMALELKQVDPPGTKYEYNNEVTNILGIVIERATRMRYAEYLSSRIWKPLGLDDASMYLDREGGSVMKSCCILSRPYDWAKLGLLFLNEGVHKEKEIIPSDWIKEMIISSPNSDYYGYQVWLGSSYIPLKPMRLIYDKDDEPPLYLTDDMITFVGFGGQRVWISPKNELVIVYATKKWSNAWNEAKLPNMILQSLQ
jgi:CubicO group peptidase (beta-lactamase class C family)